MERRDFIKDSAISAVAVGSAPHTFGTGRSPLSLSQADSKRAFWPNGARLAISISLMFEGGRQAISGAGGPISEPIKDGLPDLTTNAFFAYGHYEGIPRALNLFDKHKIKVSSFMIGKAIEQAPELAREIVRRGHEAAAHGRPPTIFPAKKRSASLPTQSRQFTASPDKQPSDGMPTGSATPFTSWKRSRNLA